MHHSDFLPTLRARGFIHQCTDEAQLSALLAEKPIAAYIGFDCTAPSLHVGSLVQIMMLRWLQQCGHKPIVLMGGGTTKIGDPSGKDTSRPQLSDEEINANMSGIKQAFSKFLRFGEGPGDAVMVNNDDWLSGLDYIGFLRDYGRMFSINRMLGKESVKIRLERDQNLSFLEFNYMIMQAYDFMELNKRHHCRLQMGGSDQWGNIITGIELNHHCKLPQVFGLTTPLLTTAGGAKMGKTADGAVWLNADRLSPYDYWQFWRNTADADVKKFLLLFTELSIPEIDAMDMEGAAINEAKKRLATEATALLHGREEAERAAHTAQQVFEQGITAEALPEIPVSMQELEAGIPAFKLFVLAGLAKSGSEARRLIQGGGARVNDAAIASEETLYHAHALTPEGFLKLSAGKKRHVKLVAR